MRRLSFAFLVAAALTIFALPLLRREVFTLRDHTDYFQPLRFYTAEVLQRGHLPLWNPYNASGEPWLANPQTGVFYPPTWLFLGLPFETAYMLYLFFHIVVLGCGAYLLFEHDSPPHAALVGATAVMLAGPTLSLVDVSNNLATFAWIPLALWCAKGRRDTAGAFVLALAFLAGEPFFAAGAALLYAIVVIRDRRPRALAFTALLAFGIAAVQLLPFLDMLRGSDRRAGIPRAQMFRESMPLLDWLRVAVPPHGGPFDASLGQHFIPVIYVGALVAALALAGAIMRTRRVAGWLALLAVAILVGAGEHVPPVAELFARMPVTLFRYPARLVPFGALAIAAMAVHGVMALSSHIRRAEPASIVFALLIALDLRFAAQPLFVSAPFHKDVVPYERSIGRASKIVRIADANGPPENRGAAISGYLNLYDRRFDAGTAAPVVAQRYASLWESAAYGGSGEALDRLSAGWVLATRPLPPRFVPVARAANVTVYRNDRALPMAMLRRADGRIDPVDSFSVTASDSRVLFHSAVPGTVVVTQQDARGWQAFVDGVAAPTRLIDGVFRGVDVAPGRHEIVWSYQPPMLFAGALITSLALLFSIAHCVIGGWFVKAPAVKKMS